MIFMQLMKSSLCIGVMVMSFGFAADSVEHCDEEPSSLLALGQSHQRGSVFGRFGAPCPVISLKLNRSIFFKHTCNPLPFAGVQELALDLKRGLAFLSDTGADSIYVLDLSTNRKINTLPAQNPAISCGSIHRGSFASRRSSHCVG
ncbi:unnamed protein product [Polarella glacialis]|uniref:Peptidase A1 domain-containing protein n=1 Tax=Polarella glacialis TaxID=89957 RepID=A0A813JJS6_POLGL|nr:unnamed protein product [Polarella glacialis]